MEDFDNDDDDTTTTRPGPQLTAERPDDPDPNTRWSSRLGCPKLADGGSEYSPAESAARFLTPLALGGVRLSKVPLHNELACLRTYLKCLELEKLDAMDKHKEMIVLKLFR